MTKQALIEALAAIEHERWADWQRYLHSRGHQDPLTRKVTFDWDWIERWERQIATPYADLSEREKESDREQVMRYWPVFVAFVADFITTECQRDINPETCAQRWREAMQ